MSKVHMILQGKGGVGKSFIAAVLAQYLSSKERNPICIDTDPVNATFAGFTQLSPVRLEIMEGDEINTRKFDNLIELIAAAEDRDSIIDNGASSFVPLSHYVLSNHVPELLSEMGHTLVVHTVITGSQALVDTLAGFSHLVTQFKTGTEFVVWLNPYWGPIIDDGKAFEQMKVYQSNKGRVSSIIRIPDLKEETHGRDVADMLQDRQTFDEAIANPKHPIMVRQRLKLVKRELFAQLDLAATVL